MVPWTMLRQALKVCVWWIWCCIPCFSRIWEFVGDEYSPVNYAPARSESFCGMITVLWTMLQQTLGVCVGWITCTELRSSRFYEFLWDWYSAVNYDPAGSGSLCGMDTVTWTMIQQALRVGDGYGAVNYDLAGSESCWYIWFCELCSSSLLQFVWDEYGAVNYATARSQRLCGMKKVLCSSRLWEFVLDGNGAMN